MKTSVLWSSRILKRVLETWGDFVLSRLQGYTNSLRRCDELTRGEIIIMIMELVISAFVTVTKGLLKGLEYLELGGWVETIQTTALLRTTRILSRVLQTWGDLQVTQTPVEDHQLTLNLDLSRELKKLWNVKMTVIPIVIGVHGTVIKGLIKGLENWEISVWVETIQITALLRSARILKESWS